MSDRRARYHGTIGVVDLGTAAVTLRPAEDLLRETPGGAAANRLLLAEYGPEAVVFGTGPLTGTFAPASALLVATFGLPSGETCHVPLMQQAGPDLRFAGFDFLVVRGASPKPAFLQADAGKLRVLDGAAYAGLKVREVERRLKRECVSCRTVLVAGPAAERGSPFAMVSVGSRGSLDKVGLAGRMDRMNLKGLAFSGAGGLPYAAEHLTRSRDLQLRIEREFPAKRPAFISVLEGSGAGRETIEPFRHVRTKALACWHCPYPCMLHAEFVRSDPGRRAPEKGKDGVVLSDHLGWAALAARWGKEAFALAKECIALGLDPVASASLLPAPKQREDGLEFLDGVGRNEAAVQESVGNKVPLGGIPPESRRRRFNGIPPLGDPALRDERIARSLVLGICPIFLLATGLSDEELLPFLVASEEERSALAAALPEAVRTLTE
jgi:aldehyde:ferredoxin oxidoreductase